MATRRRLWVSVEVKWGFLGNRLLSQSFLDSPALSYKVSLASLFQFWKWAKSWALTFPMGEILHCLINDTKCWDKNSQHIFLNSLNDRENNGICWKKLTFILHETKNSYIWPSTIMATILDAILKKNTFRVSNSPKLFVCCLWPLIAPKTVEKRFVTICWGLSWVFS